MTVFRSLLVRVGCLLLFGLFTATGTVYTVVFFGLGAETYGEMREHSPAGSDFIPFYAGASNMISNPQHAYEPSVMRQRIIELHNLEGLDPPEELAGLLEYYNPPFFLLLLAPLTLLDTHTAYLADVALNMVALVGLTSLLGVLLRWRQPATLLVVAALFGFVPLYVAVYNTQPTIFIALLLAGAFLAVEHQRNLLGTLLLALTAAKPQWLILPGSALVRQAPRTVLPFAATGGLLILGPFILMGLGAVLDYVSLIAGRTDADLERVRYSMHLFNWAGFLSVLTGSTQPVATFILGLVTLGAFAIVWRQGDTHLTWAAAILTTLIVIPHTHSHEWMMAFPAAVFLLRRPMVAQAMAVTVALLLACHVGMTASVFAQEAVRNGAQSFYLPIPAAFAVILWCAILPALEQRLKQREYQSTVDLLRTGSSAAI